MSTAPHTPHPTHRARRRLAPWIVVVAAALLVASTHTGPAYAAAPKTTVVLAHGAFADASSWNGVSERLQRGGYTVLAPALPLRGVASDADYLASIVKMIPGPVVLVGHSYAGEVIGQAAVGLANVKALVFVDGLALDVGESANLVGARFTNSLLGPALLKRPYPGAGNAEGTDLYVDPAKFPAIFGADLPRWQARVLAAAQRPIEAAAFDEKVTGAAWKTIPSSFVFGKYDRAIDPAELAFLAHRAGGPMTKTNGSHLSLISHAATVARVIKRASSRR